jgi:tetratricopeptide (TPR) repeat protein
MSGLILGYNYDIFVSYRQKDNKHDGWVSEFVDHLKAELEATFKEEISVYFDNNPHDGLLETHDVDASLQNKLKCLIFMPVISRTYCDPNAFSWEHEFKAFIEQASRDRLGLKITLPNGNVASRVLPVRITDLDPADNALCESLLGGVMRGVDFIYREPGVNRPLRPAEDKPQANLNHTNYRNQINKVALAVREIISGLKSGAAEELYQERAVEMAGQDETRETKDTVRSQSGKVERSRIQQAIAGIMASILIVLAGYLIATMLKKSGRLQSSDGRISVAVMPFVNMTNDTLWDLWQGGIQNELITSLTNTAELKVRQIETINSLLQSKGVTSYASMAPNAASVISRTLEANVIINGSINHSGDKIRVNTQVIDPRRDEIIKSFQIESPAREEMIFGIIDSLSARLRDFLVLTQLRKKTAHHYMYVTPTNSPDAYRYFVMGQTSFNKGDFRTAIDLYLQAIGIDSGFYSAKTMLSVAYYNGYLYDPAKKWCLDVYRNKDQMDISRNTHVKWLYALLFETPYEEIKYINQSIELDDQYASLYYELGRLYVSLDQYDDAIEAMEKTFDIYRKWEIKPRWANDYIMLGYAYHETEKYRKESSLYKKAEKDFPDDVAIAQRKAILLLTLRDTVEANRYIAKYMSGMKNFNVPETSLAAGLAYIYAEGGFPDKAEKCYRDVLALDPENPASLNNLGWFLINNERNIDEGLEYIEKSLQIRPDHYLTLENKALALYKKGSYGEALQLLEKARDLRPVYNHANYKFIEKVRNASAGRQEADI